ncbi:XRN2 [Hepatospora eriocheir]|nr:XRN2 [Hepatospora eriocheir]
MGVPSLFKWLKIKYQGVTTKMLKGLDYNVDCLYLDFNAIIHPCTIKECNSLEDVDRKLYENIDIYLNNLIHSVYPRKLIYISVDGPAPAAKIN